mgnify:CR=1 FL=1
MSNVFQHHTARTTAGFIPIVVLLNPVTATMPDVDWPVQDDPAYSVRYQHTASYSTYDCGLFSFVTPPTTISDFAREIAGLYADLLEGQEPLGAEFEAIWDANVDELYET